MIVVTDRRVALVHEAHSFSTNTPVVVKVTLPREPWVKASDPKGDDKK
jgi:hypothetical protein